MANTANQIAKIAKKRAAKAGVKAQAPKMHVKRGDTVVVIAGKDKGKTGTVKQVLRDKQRVIVEGINMVKKATRPNPMMGIQGGHVEMEAAIHVSNVMLYSTKETQAVPRPKTETITGESGKMKRVRVCRKTGEQLDT